MFDTFLALRAGNLLDEAAAQLRGEQLLEPPSVNQVLSSALQEVGLAECITMTFIEQPSMAAA